MKTIRSLLLLGLLAAVSLGGIAAPGHAQNAPPPADPPALSDPIATPAPATVEVKATPTPSETFVITAPEEAVLTWQQALIPLVTPFLVAGLRKLIPSINKAWLPIAAALLGALGDVLAHFTTGSSLNIWLGLGLGLAGVGVREASKQIKAAALTPA